MGRRSTGNSRLDALLARQDGVVTRQQVLACGEDSAFIRRRLRSGAWLAVYRGVYITHTGELTWRQRCWCAVLDAEPAALSHESALRAAGVCGARDRESIQLVVAAGRPVTARPGVVVRRTTRMAETVLPHTHPPRVRVEEAVLDVAARASGELAVVATLADAVQSRWTTADRLLTALADRPRIRRRDLIEEILTDVAAGAASALEHRYLTRVERAHGLPRGVRQSPTDVGRPGFRDVEYLEYGLVVELDGRLFHSDAAARDRDMERDLDAAVGADLQTLRLGWGQGAVRTCPTAVKVGTVLNARGWAGAPHPCSDPDCAVRSADM